MTYTRQQLINALNYEHILLIHDDFDADCDMTADEHLAYVSTLSDAELIAETDTDDTYTLDEYMSDWLPA